MARTPRIAKRNWAKIAWISSEWRSHVDKRKKIYGTQCARMKASETGPWARWIIGGLIPFNIKVAFSIRACRVVSRKEPELMCSLLFLHIRPVHSQLRPRVTWIQIRGLPFTHHFTNLHSTLSIIISLLSFHIMIRNLQLKTQETIRKKALMKVITTILENKECVEFWHEMGETAALAAERYGNYTKCNVFRISNSKFKVVLMQLSMQIISSQNLS